MDTAWLTTLQRLLEQGRTFVLVTVVEALGSTPQDQGARMLVTETGLEAGTVGGGKVEKKAIEEAQFQLSQKDRQRCKLVKWNLKRDVGMTCGGSMRLFFEVYQPSSWPIVVFGAGHVANALIQTLLRLDCRITCFDTREEWLRRLPESPKLRKVLSSDLQSEVKDLTEHAFVLLMTMGHSTDKPILTEILRTRTLPYLGVIGSDAKARQLRKDMQEAGIPKDRQDKFYCPIGLPIGTNHPSEIAISITAQLLEIRDFERTPKIKGFKRRF